MTSNHAAEKAAALLVRLHNLPIWAQDHIAMLERERNAAVRRLDEFADSQTKSPISYEEHLFVDGQWRNVRRYVQTTRIEIDYANTDLSILCREGGSEGGDCLAIQYGRERRVRSLAVMQPQSYQHFHIFGVKR